MERQLPEQVRGGQRGVLFGYIKIQSCSVMEGNHLLPKNQPSMNYPNKTKQIRYNNKFQTKSNLAI
jgi:hypothetical protein